MLKVRWRTREEGGPGGDDVFVQMANSNLRTERVHKMDNKIWLGRFTDLVRYEERSAFSSVSKAI